MRRVLAWVGVGLALAGCEAIEDKTDYNRHTMSTLYESRVESDVLVFEATTSALYPAESEAGEAQRMIWLEGWVKRLGFCPAGYEILSREKIDPMEVNVRRHDLRYRVQCKAGPPPAD